ncbi:b-cell lymphoma 3-encoded protein [Phlyctema vagabunda]|uniref:B-cell lymphoma 3-encoded protein n=1 Tax=Phlyctema vagabunda TaxID=108571 RepID=A0ABR4P8J4_9HELO
MDPLSVTASIVALIGAGNQIAVGMNKLASLRGAPASILALNNELSDLRLILSEAEVLLVEHGTRDMPRKDVLVATKTFLPSFQLAWNRLQDLESIKGRLTNRSGGINRLAWLWEQDAINKAQKGLRAARIDILAVLGLISSKSSFRIEAQLQEVQSTTVEGSSYISHAIDRQTEAPNQILQSQAIYEDDGIEKGKLQIMEQQQGSSVAIEKFQQRWHSGSSGALYKDSQFSALRMRFLRRRRCASWCPCRCHAQIRLHTPQLLQRVVGQLLVGYTGFPSWTGSCDRLDACQGKTAERFIQVNYYFPPWFLSRVLNFSLSTSNLQKPEYSLRMLNVRSTFEAIFDGADKNDAALVRSLICNNKASVLDITDDGGHSPLHLAVKKSNVEAVKALLEMGAEPYLENATQETPYDMAWSTILCFQHTPNAATWRVEEIRALFPGVDVVEERRRFTKIHKIVNQILHCDLEKELCRSRDLIDQVDADGRTALSYAAARGDHMAVDTLLRYGADPNIADRIGQGPLRQSMKASDGTCARLLLKAGANIQHRDKWKQTSLISSVFHPHPLPFVTALLLGGADVNVVDFQGSSPLMEAMKFNAPGVVQLLLDHHADANAVDHFGMSPIMQGIRHNSHASLKVLLDSAGHLTHSQGDRSQKTVLHWAAELGDTETIRMLAQMPLDGFSVHDKTVAGLTAIDLAENRLEMEKLVHNKSSIDTEWLAAFRDLLEAIRVPTTNASPSSLSSDDTFYDALQQFKFEELSELAEEGGIRQAV